MFLRRRFGFILTALVLFSGLPAVAAPQLELFANFNTLGVIIHLDNTTQADSASVSYRASTEASFRQGQPLTFVQGMVSPRLAGSLFNLLPGETYTVRVRINGGSANGILLQGSVRTRATEAQIPPGLTQKYAAPDGSGTRCSVTQPCDLDTAIAQYARACHEIILADGVYYAGGYTLDDDTASASCPMVIRAADGATPIIHGAPQLLNNWTSRGNGLYCTPVSTNILPSTTYDRVFNRFSMVLYQGQRLYPFLSLAELQNFTVSASNADYDVAAPIPVPYDGFTVDNGDVCVHLRSGQRPATDSVRLSIHTFGFRVRAPHVHFRGLAFRYFGHSRRAIAIRLDPIGFDADDQAATAADYAVVSHNTFHVNDVGVGVGLNADHALIEHNVFEELLVNEWPWDSIKLRDGLLSELEAGGVYFFGDLDARQVAQGTVIRHNQFSGYFDGVSICPLDDAQKLEYRFLTDTSEVDFHDNLVFNIGDDGVEADGYCANVRIWNNTFHDIVVAISVAPSFGGPVYLVRNLAYRFIPRTINGNVQEYAPTLKLYAKASWIAGTSTAPDCAGDPTQVPCIGPLFIYHNTINARDYCYDDDFDCHRGFIMSLDRSQTQVASIRSRNNIYHGAYQALFKRGTDVMDDYLSFDYDNLSLDRVNEPVEWVNIDLAGSHGAGGYGPGCRIEYADLVTFYNCTGQQQHGLTVDSRFRSSTDHRLRDDSPLIDRGVLLPGINDNFGGSAPDIGYWERDLRPLGWIFSNGFE